MVVEPPVLDRNYKGVGYTKVDFLLDYAAVGWGFLDPRDYNDEDKSKSEDKKRRCTITNGEFIKLERILRMRTCQMAVYLGPSVSVLFNNDHIPFKTLESLAKVIYEGKKYFHAKFTLAPQYGK